MVETVDNEEIVTDRSRNEIVMNGSYEIAPDHDMITTVLPDDGIVTALPVINGLTHATQLSGESHCVTVETVVASDSLVLSEEGLISETASNQCDNIVLVEPTHSDGRIFIEPALGDHRITLVDPISEIPEAMDDKCDTHDIVMEFTVDESEIIEQSVDVYGEVVT